MKAWFILELTHTHTYIYLCKPTRTRSKSPMLISLCTTMLIHLLWDRSNSIYRPADLLRQFNGNANLCKCNFISSWTKVCEMSSRDFKFRIIFIFLPLNFSISFLSSSITILEWYMLRFKGCFHPEKLN